MHNLVSHDSMTKTNSKKLNKITKNKEEIGHPNSESEQIIPIKCTSFKRKKAVGGVKGE